MDMSNLADSNSFWISLEFRPLLSKAKLQLSNKVA